MKAKWNLRTVFTVAVLLIVTTTSVGLLGNMLGLQNNSLLPNVPRVHAQTTPILGVDCGLGSTTGVGTPSSVTTYTTNTTGTPNTYSFGPGNTPVTGDGALDTSCSWSGDASATFNGGVPDTTPEPIVADVVDSAVVPNPFSCTAGTPSGCVSANYGGGFSADIRVVNLDPTCNIQITSTGCPNGFDITVSYDPKILSAVAFDQFGLEFCPTLGSTPGTASNCGQPLGSGGIILTAATIDNTVGQARLSEALLGVATFPDTTGNGGVTLFKVRFDVIGVGTSNISPTGTLTNPGAIAHTEQAATFEDTTIFDPTALGWHASFAFTPNPPVPGSSLKFTATVSCGLCTAPFNFAWDTNSDGLTEGGGTVNPFTVTPPPPIVNRVTLTVGDAAAHSVTLVQLVPFAVTLTGPASLALNATGTYNGLWLGGSPTYSGTFRLCSGAPSTQLRVCTNPNPAVAGTALQTSTQSNIYRFSGLYTNKLTITTTASGGVPATSVTATLLTNVTGTKPAFSVVAAGNMSSVQVNHPITYTGTASYAGGFNGYPAYSRSGDSLINGTAPALGTVMHSDTRIVFVDVATGGQGTTANNLWDPSEWIFFCSGVAPGGACTTVPATGAFVLYQGIGTRPAAATITKRDAHIDCVCTNNAFAQGQVVIYDYDSTNAAAGVPYDVFLSFTFLFGDGTQTQVSASGTTPSGGFTATTSHSYISPGPVSPKVIVQETGTPSGTPQIGPLSAIVEQGFTGTITVTPPVSGITVTVTCGSATAGKPVTCNATATGGNGGPYTFTWTAPSGSPSTGSGPSFTTTYAVKGTFQVTANATDTASNKGSASVMVTVTAQPIVVTVSCGSATAGKPVTCNASATGGTTPFTFSWSAPGGSPATGTGASFTTTYAAKGTFVVNATATDNNGAKAFKTASIVVAAQPLQATISAACVNALAAATVGKPISCSATASGGTAPYTFRWTAVGGTPSTGTGATFTVSYATKGTFTLTVNATDTNNKSATQSVTNFVVSGQPIVVTVTCGTATAGKPVTCNASASGGTAPYTFTWASKGTPATGTGTSYTTTFAAKGSQVVNATARDNNAVTKLGQATVVVTAQPVVVTVTCGSATAGKPVTCNASATGGTAPYTFSWSAPGGSPATGTGAGFTTTYATKGTFVVNATATDLNGAKKSQTASIVVAGQPIVVTVTCGTATAGKPVTCNASATGGTAPYTFTWASKGTPATGTGASYTTTFAAKGSQVVNATARDNNAATKLGQATVVVAAQPIVVTVTCGTATVGKPVTCNASATGGTAPYTFSWFAPGGSPATGTGASFTTTYATKGTFVVNATATDLNGAKKSQTASVNVAGQAFAVTVTCGSATAGKPVTCNASATGGTAPYTFSWSAPGGSPATGTGASFTTTYATKGTFVVNATATDNNNSKKSATASIVVAGQAIVVTVTCGSATAGKPVTCNASATGGTAPFTFSWSAPGGSPATGTGASFTTTYATKGTFVVNATATDNNGVKKSQTASIVVAAQPIVVTVTCGTATVNQPVTCNASATGGTPPYTFTWASRGTPATGTGTSYTTTFATKGPQVINATARDNNAATKLGQATVNVVGTPLAVTVTCGSATVGKPVTCNASATGGTSPFTFSWSAPGGSPATGTGASFTTTYAAKGTFVVNATATDANQAKKSQTAGIVVAGQPIVVTVTCGTATAGKPVTCNASATGGTPPYTFTWASRGTPATGTGTSYTTTFATKGSQVVNATARDNNAATKLGQATVVVAAQPIVVTVTCGSATTGKPVTCNASATGGTSPYTFSWSAPGGSPSTGTGASFTTTYAAKGTFVVNATATDLNGAKKSQTASVNVAGQAFAVSVTCGSATAGKPVTCNASASGGTPPFTFSWSAPGGSPATGTGASFTTTYATKGTFVVNATATDNNNSKKSATANVVVTGQPIVVTVTCGTATAGKPVTCNASATGGTAPYTFSWSAPGGSPATGTGASFTTTYAAKGTFVVNATATDNNGAKKSQTASIAVTAQAIVVTVTCGTATAGQPVTCNASATGGTAPFTFTWASKGTPATGTGPSYTTTFAAKGPQVVNATARDNNGATKLGQATVNVQGTPLVVTVTCGTATVGKPVTCNASASGDTPPYTFSWSAPGGSPATGTGASFTTTYAAKGTFVVNATATDNNGVKKSQTASIVVTGQPIVVTVTCGSATAGKPVTCNASATGGTAPFTFSWSAPGGSPSTGTGASFTTTYAAKGTFVVNATATDNNGVKKSQTASIVVTGQPIVVTVTCGTATVNQPVTCNASATGGTPPYTFTWASRGTPATGTGTSYTTTFATKGPQVINATARDNNAATKLGQATVNVVGTPISVTVTCGSATAGKPVTCNVSATGGTPPFTFSWSAPGGSPATGTGASFTTTYATKGTFVVNATATDANQAKVSRTASIVVAGQPIVVTVTCGTATAGKPVTCNASATGGTAPYTFSWSAPGGSPATGTGASFTTTYATKGTFVVNATATDNNGAKKSQTASIAVTAQPIVVTINCGSGPFVVNTPVTCNASATGGTAPYTFTWASKGTPATGTGTSYTTTFSSSQTGPQTINATARDNNGATKLGQITITIQAGLIITVTCPGSGTAGKPVTCNATTSGGTGTVTITWSSNGSPATGTGSSYTATLAAKGTLRVNGTATDSATPPAHSSQVVNVVINGQPIVVTVTCGSATAGKPVTCNASATGGTAPFTFSWSAPGGSPTTGTGASFTTTYAAKGTFVVNATATDFNGVKKSQTVSIVVTGQPIVVTVTCGSATSGKPVTCNASATGGTAPYTFSWSAPGGSPATGTGASFTTTYATKGTFVVNATATDNNGAKKSQTSSVVVAAQAIVVSVTCGTATAGQPVTCTASATGGTAPFTFTWASKGTPATGTGSSYTTTFATKGPQVVNATARDNNGATKLGQATVNVQGSPLVVTVTCGTATAGKPVTCNASASGDTPPYTFSWSAPGGSPATGTGASFTTTYATKGTFVVNATATDNNGVKKSQIASIVVTGQPIVVTVTCGSATAGKPVTCNASATGGTAPFTFSWSAPGGSPTTGTGASFTTTYATKGTFTVNATATDNNGAKKSQTASVAVAAQQFLVTVTCGTATAGQPVTCNASATGGTPPYTFTWASKGTPATGTGSSYTTTFATKGPQVVNATARDNNGATKLGQATVNVQGSPLVVTVTCGTATAGKPVTCNASASGDTPPYTFSWSAPGGSPATGTGASFTTTYAAKGTFVVNATATDNNGVKKSQTASIVVTGQPIVVTVTCGTGTAGKPVTCNASATGGTAPYTFTWSAPGGAPSTGTGASFTTTYSVKGTFVVNATATDGNNAKKSATASVVVAPQPLTITVTCGTATVGKPVTCTASITGGTAPITFTWASRGTPATGTGSSYTTTFAAKGPQVVNATARDNNAVTKLGQATVNVAGQSFTVTVSCGTATAGKPVTCNASASGGTPPFTFTWSAPGGNPATGSGTSFTTTYAAKGTFVVNATATDANNSKKSATASVVVAGQPIVVTVTCGSATAGKPVTCNVSATGGTAPITFSWAAPGGNPSTGTGSSFTTSYAVKGTFVVNATATDANGAKKSATASIAVAAQPLTVTISQGATATVGKPVTFTAAASGGTGPYSFSWSAPGGNPASGSGASFTTTYSSSGSQTVSVTATDANLASKVQSLTFNVQAQGLVITVTCPTSGTAGKPVTCNASAVGGTPPYTFTWSSNGSPATGTGTSYTTTLAAKGTLSVTGTVTDTLGATNAKTVAVPINGQPIVVSVTCGSATAGKPVTCNASASGGTAPFTFTWSSNGSPATGTGASYTTTFATKGSQTVTTTARDANGVSMTTTTTVTVTGQPIVVTVTCGTATAGKPVTCNASASGGTAPFTFTWASNGTPSTGTGSSYTTTFASKGSQTVTATAKDTNGVSQAGTATVNVAGQPITVTVTCGTATVGKPVTCTASASGGTSPFTFSWSAPGASPSSGSGSSFTTTYAVKGTNTITVTATDTNGATKTGTASVTVQGQNLMVSATCGSATAGKPVTCSASGSGGTGPYTFTWSAPNGSPSSGSGSSFTTTYAVKATNTITVTVRDANTGTATSTVQVIVSPQPLTAGFTSSPTNPTAGKPVSFTSTVTGGTAPYSYSWNFGDGTPMATVANPSHSFAIKGTYQVRLNVTDGNNQRVSATHSVIVTAQTLTISGATGTPNPGQVNQPVTFSATITGGTSPYVVTWTFGDTTTGTGNPTTHSYTAIGTFTVTVVARDANAATSNTFTFTETIQTTSLTGSITITDGSLCPLTNNQFALNFVNDPKSPGFFSLVSSNPGELYDNIFVNGAAGTPVTLNINLPYPMVTKGSTSVQVFSGFTTMGGCFMPTGQLSSFTITGTPVTLSSYSPQNFGSMATIRVTGNMPSSGMLYVNVHMDYGLKKTTGWTQGAAQGSSFQALNPGLGLVLNNGQSYTFTLTGSASASASVTSVNQFKKDPGFGGAVTSKVTGNSLAGVTISIYDNKNNLVGITTTDQYGFYSFQYKYTGATKAFYVYASVPGSAVQSQIQITTMETNQVVLANFEF